MRLEIKEEFRDYYLGGGSIKKVRIGDIPKSKYQFYYDMGYSSFFVEYTDEQGMIKDTLVKDGIVFKKKVKSILEEGGIYLKKLNY